MGRGGGEGARVVELAVLGVVFLLVSAVFAMVGLGGGILYVPILLFAGYGMREAPAISLVLIVATSVTALWTYWRSGRVDWKLALVIDPPTDVMAFVGGYASGLVPERLLLGVLAAVLVVAGLLMLRGNARGGPGGARPAGGTGARRSPGRSGRWWWHRRFRGDEYAVHLPLVLSVTAAVGLLSGMLGITGGILKLPVMVLLCGVPMDVAVGTSTAMVALTAACGLAGHAIRGPVDWRVALLLALAALAGGLLGSRVSLGVDRGRLRRLFGVLLLLVAARLAWRLLA